MKMNGCITVLDLSYIDMVVDGDRWNSQHDLDLERSQKA